jgi:hypothetical protein
MASLQIGGPSASITGVGTPWVAESTTTASLNAVTGVNSARVVAVGDAGKVLESNGGGTWTERTIAGSPDLLGNASTTGGYVYIAGKQRTLQYETVAGGAFASVTLPTAASAVTLFTAIWSPSNNNTVIAIGDAQKYVSFVEGTNPGNAQAMAITNRVNGVTGLYTSGGALLTACAASDTNAVQSYSSAAGNWTATTFVGSAINLYGAWQADASTIYVVGTNATILKGTTCSSALAAQPVSLAVAATLKGVWASSATDVYAVGDNGTILRSSGSAWTVEPSGTTKNLRAIWGTSPSNVYIVGDGIILHKGP